MTLKLLESVRRRAAKGPEWKLCEARLRALGLFSREEGRGDLSGVCNFLVRGRRWGGGEKEGQKLQGYGLKLCSDLLGKV